MGKAYYNACVSTAAGPCLACNMVAKIAEVGENLMNIAMNKNFDTLDRQIECLRGKVAVKREGW